MRHEGIPNFDMSTAVATPETQTEEILRTREQFYESVQLGLDPIFCPDDRGLDFKYIKMFGGAPGPVCTKAVLEETYRPGSVNSTLEGDISYMVPIMEEAGLKPGIHSDVQSEAGKQIITTKHEGPFGCAYLFKRALISSTIAANYKSIIPIAASLRPGDFRTSRSIEFAQELASAHGRLAERQGFIQPGRKLALAALMNGAQSIVLDGEHTATVGIFNMREGTSLNAGNATAAGLAVYSVDAWAKPRVYERLHREFPFDRRDLAIADAVEDVAVMMALGVETIATRR